MTTSAPFGNRAADWVVSKEIRRKMTRSSIEQGISLLYDVWIFHPWHECRDPGRCRRFPDKEAALLWLQRFKSDQMR